MLFVVSFLGGCQFFWGAEGRFAAPEEAPPPEQETTVAEPPEPPVLNDATAGNIFRHYLAANIAEIDGDLAAAGVFYKNALEADPFNTILMEKAFVYLLASGQYEAALEVARNLTEMAPKQPLVEMTIVYDDALAGRYAKALKRLKEMREKAPNLIQFELLEEYIKLAQGTPVDDIIAELKNFEVGAGLIEYKYYHLGRLYLRAGRTEEALKTFNDGQLLGAQPLFVVQALGTELNTLGRFDEAIATYNAFLALNPESALVQTGLQAAKMGKKPVRTPLTLADDLMEVAYGLAALLVENDLNETVRQFLQLALMAKKDAPMALFMLGLLDEDQQKFDSALAFYSTIPEGAVPYLAAQMRIAETLFDKGEEEAAISTFQTLINQHPSLTFLHRSLGQLYFSRGFFEKAITHYTHALEHSPKLEEPAKVALLFARGAAYERQHSYEKAAADLQQALEIQPTNPTILNYLGYMWLDRGENLEDAYEYIRKAARLRPHDGAIVDSLGWLHYKKGEYELAIRYLEKAASLLPHDPVIHIHLGRAYAKVGRINEAKAKWRRALELDLKDEASIKEVQTLLSM